MPAILLSVIIPTRNRAALLSNALRSLQQQTLPAECFEVLVVDNASADHSRDLVRQTQTKMKNLHYFYTAVPGLHAARHLGMEKAHSDLLVYTDDDSEAFPTWLEAIADGFARHHAALVGGKCLPKFENEPPRWLMKRWTTPGAGRAFRGRAEHPRLRGSSHRKCRPPVSSAAISRSAGRRCWRRADSIPIPCPRRCLITGVTGKPGWRARWPRKGGKVLYHPQAAVSHFVPASRMTHEYFYRRNFAEGITRSFVQIRRAHRLDDLPAAGPPPARSWRQRLLPLLRRLGHAPAVPSSAVAPGKERAARRLPPSPKAVPRRCCSFAPGSCADWLHESPQSTQRTHERARPRRPERLPLPQVPRASRCQSPGPGLRQVRKRIPPGRRIL